MKTKFATFFKQIALLFTIMFYATMHSQIVSTFAGSGNAGSANGTGTLASFNEPSGVALDGSGNLFVVDNLNFKIRKISPTGIVTTFAGSGMSSSIDGIGTAASFQYCSGLTIDFAGNLYVAEYSTHKIRKITPAGVVTTLAGSGVSGAADGIGTAASFFYPFGLTVDFSGNVYVADMSNNKIRKITSAGVVTTLAGSGSIGASDGMGAAASFNMPEGLVVDGIGNVYVADTYNNIIRKITPSGVVTTIAGTGSAASINGNGISASFWAPRTIALDNSGNFYISDFRKIRKMSSTGVVTDFAGSGLPGCIDGQASSATIDLARGLATNATGELIYFSETNFNKIRRVLSCNSTPPQSPVATITQPSATTPTGVITITSPIGAFEYSIDNINYQSSTVFTNVTPGNYNVTVRKSASIGCVSISTNLTVNPAPSQSGNMKIAGGSGHTLLVCSDNSLWAFGYNYFGQLGNGTNTSTKTPVQITSINDIKAVASSGLHSIVLKNDGTVWAFGKNNSGQLGTGNLLNSNTPVQVTTLSNIIEIAVGYQHSLAVKNDGTVWAWGRNDNGQLGIGNYTDQSLPYQIGSLTNGSAVSAAFDHSLVLKNDGTVWSFGRNYFGQLGNGSNTISNIPVNVFNLSSIISIAAGNQRSIALKSNGTVWAWGRNDNGEHGDGTTTNVNIPVQTSVLNNITKIVTKENSSFALKNDGSVWAWGSNIYNELGIGTTNYNNIPLSINSLTNISDIETGIGHAFAVSSSGIVWAWGSNSDGEIGNGSTTNVYTTPITVSGFCGNQIGIMEINQNNSVTIYPNPNSGVFKIISDLPSTAATVKIYNTHGQSIYESVQFVEEIDLSNQPKGVYFLQIKSQEGIINKKLILQ